MTNKKDAVRQHDILNKNLLLDGIIAPKRGAFTPPGLRAIQKGGEG